MTVNPSIQARLSPVIVAAQEGHNDVLTTLLDAKADINAQGLVRFLAPSVVTIPLTKAGCMTRIVLYPTRVWRQR
jgi:hypothetical protein